MVIDVDVLKQFKDELIDEISEVEEKYQIAIDILAISVEREAICPEIIIRNL